MIQAVELTRRYPEGEVGCSRVSFKVLPGQVYALLGGTSSGKSTVMNLFAGFIRPDSGRAEILGRDCHADGESVRRMTAYIAGEVSSEENLPAWRYLAYLVRLAGQPSPGRKEAERALREMGIPENAMEMPVSRLASAHMQLLLLAAARCRDVRALLLDAPTTGLDARSARHLAAQIKGMKTAGRAILVATHDIFFAFEVADIVGILSQGVLIIEGPRNQEDLLRRTYLQATTSI